MLADKDKRPADRFRAARRPEARIELLGGFMDLVKPVEVFHYAEGRIRAGEKCVIANHNLHSLYLLSRNARLADFFRLADLVQIDSAPLILWARLMGKPSRAFHRSTYLDWRDQFWAWTERNDFRVFFVGGRPGVAERAKARLKEQWPNVEIGVHHGYFDLNAGSSGSRAVIRQVRNFAPHILLVGLGMPAQESWILDHADKLPPCAMFTVGAAFDYEAGVQIACPRWLGRIGAEWLFRLATNPRLARRYLIEPWCLLTPAIRDLARRMQEARASAPAARSRAAARS
jgi:N-acetylglucosaminyldiphosphoundecaprenol N-acetyl-beta-D-mannosaminyltransferase